jgi:hypothetical protein
MSMKNFSDTIGDRTRDLPACSAVPQLTAPPRAPFTIIKLLNLLQILWDQKIKFELICNKFNIEFSRSEVLY